MTRNCLRISLLLCFYSCFFRGTPATGQNPDSALLSIYQKNEGDQAAIYNGRQYLRPVYSFEKNAHVFFETDKMVRGSVIYQGLRYDSVNLIYDENSDELVTNDYNVTDLVTLFKERVTGFSILGQNFIRLGNDSGYFQVLYQGPSLVLKKEIKKIVEKPDVPRTLYFIEVIPSYYFSRNGSYQKISGKESLLKVFGDRRKEVNAFMKANKVKFKKNREDAILRSVAYYDQLTR